MFEHKAPLCSVPILWRRSPSRSCSVPSKWGACWIGWEEYRQCRGWGSTHSVWTISPEQHHLFTKCFHKTVSWHLRERWRWCWCWRWPPPPSRGCSPRRDRSPSGCLSFFRRKQSLNLNQAQKLFVSLLGTKKEENNDPRSQTTYYFVYCEVLTFCFC